MSIVSPLNFLCKQPNLSFLIFPQLKGHKKTFPPCRLPVAEAPAPRPASGATRANCSPSPPPPQVLRCSPPPPRLPLAWIQVRAALGMEGLDIRVKWGCSRKDIMKYSHFSLFLYGRRICVTRESHIRGNYINLRTYLSNTFHLNFSYQWNWPEFPLQLWNS